MRTVKRAGGFILIPVVVAIAIIGVLAFYSANQSAINANSANSELEATRADYVAQAGLQHALRQTAEQGCGPYTDLTDVAIGDASYSTNLKTDLKEPDSYTVSVDQDGWIRDDNPTTTHPSDTNLHFRSDGVTERPVYRYDLSAIPAQASVISAVAYFYVSKEHPEGPIDIHALNKDWTEDTANWDLLGDAMDAKVQATIPAQPVAGVWVSVNLTPQVQAWVNGQPNYGITLNSRGDGAHGDYASRETSFAPYLEVVAGTPPSPVARELKSTGITASGLSRTLKTQKTINLAQSPGSYLHLQPGPDEVKDAWLPGDKGTWNYGAATFLRARQGGGGHWHSAIQFNLGLLPKGARIISATLELYRLDASTQDAPGPIDLHVITQDWVEGSNNGGTGAGATWDLRNTGLAWNNPGGDYDATPVASVNIDTTKNTWFSWDIAAAVQDWVDGTRANHGLMLVAGTFDARSEFAGSDEADPTLRPKLSIAYTCACGQVCSRPQGSGKIALIGDDSSPDADDEIKKEIFESWGYQVDFYEDWFSDGINWNNYDLAYVSETVIAADVRANLANLSIGVVNEEPRLYGDLDLASGNTDKVGSSIEIVDNSHFITSVFPQGPLSIYSGDMEIQIANTPLAAGLQTLGEFGGAATLTATEKGAPTISGTAAGRRVTLPLGQHANAGFDWQHLNGNGLLLVQRAIEWVAANTAGNDYYLDEFPDFECDKKDEYRGSSGTLDWSGFAWTEIGDDDRACGADFRVVDDPDIDDPSGNRLRLKNKNRRIIRQVDLSSFDSAGLSFDYRRRNTSGAAQLQVLVSGDGGSTWTTLDWFGAGDDSVYQSVSYDISAFTGADTFIGFAVNDDFSGEAYIDNVRVDSEAPPAKLPIAHWKLDENSGTTAVDSEGGHDGTLNNGPTWANAQVGGGLAFDGNDDYVDLTSNAELDDVFNGGATVTAWIYLDGWGEGAYGRVLDKSSAIGGERDGWMIGTDGGNQSIAFAQGFSGTRGFWRPQNNTVNLNEWVHYAIVYDASSDANDPVIYLNGVEQTSLVKIAPSGTIRSDAGIALRMGNHAQDTSRTLDGKLDDVRIYDRMLSAGEIAELATPPPKLPIAHWKLDETSGLTAVDSAGGHNGTLVNDPAWTTGQVNGALDFDGNDDQVTVPHSTKLDLAGEFTISTWFKADSLGDNWDPYRTFLGKYPNASTANYWFGTWGDELAFGFYAGGSFHAVYSSGLGLQTGRWYHATVIFTDAGNAAKLYIDGVGISKGGITASPPPNSGDVVIGQTPVDEPWHGQLDDIRIYDQILTDAEIAELAGVGGGGGGGGNIGGNCEGTYRDNFDTASWSNSDGTLDWSATPWEEVGESDGAGTGDVVIASGQLRIRDNDNGGEGVQRLVNIDGAAAAALAFDYKRTGLDNTNDYVALSISTNGFAGPWTELQRFTTPNDSSPQSYSVNISAHIGANTAIRLLSSPNLGGRDQVEFDNLRVSCLQLTEIEPTPVPTL